MDEVGKIQCHTRPWISSSCENVCEAMNLTVGMLEAAKRELASNESNWGKAISNINLALQMLTHVHPDESTIVNGRAARKQRLVEVIRQYDELIDIEWDLVKEGRKSTSHYDRLVQNRDHYLNELSQYN